MCVGPGCVSLLRRCSRTPGALSLLQIIRGRAGWCTSRAPGFGRPNGVPRSGDRDSPMVRIRLDERVVSAPLLRARVCSMLHVAAIVFCDRCEAATARTERGWRAYITPAKDGKRSVTVVCPVCAEQGFGEDAAPD